jgi:hypothetical protein
VPVSDGNWEPLSVAAVAELLAGVQAPWWIAGGWAIDLFVGGPGRQHADIDVLVLRRDLGSVQEQLRGWELHAADPPGRLRPWGTGEQLPPQVHDIWCRPSATSPWALQLMVDDTIGEDWVYRRDPRIRRPVSTLAGPASTTERLVLAPEVQLLYKSAHPRAKDVDDLRRSLAFLGNDRRNWLRMALTLVDPAHSWLADV